MGKPQDLSPRLGAHLSIGKGLDGTARSAVEMEVETCQIFLRNPRGAGFRVWKDAEVATFKETIASHQIGPVVAHIPYIVNPASGKDDLYELAQRIISEDLKRCDLIGAAYLVLHPGSKGDLSLEEAIARLAALLNRTLAGYDGQAMILIETMAGMGKEICASFEEIRMLWQAVEGRDHLGVCLDTCHLLAAGYDMVTVDGIAGMLAEAEKKIGLDKIKVVHANDSQKGKGSRVDRHAPIGTGHIGREGFANLMRNPFLRQLPFILETPTATLAQDLAALREIRVGL